jgi:hypothetical protein
VWIEVQDLQRIARANRGRSAWFAVIAVLAGCGSEPSRSVPVECKGRSVAVERALERAPGAVRLGGTRLSACFAPGADPGDVQTLGLTLLPAAEHLAVAARAHPGGPAPLRLGYLVGAVRRGAARGGVYAELERRLEQELAGVDTGSAAYRRGALAGREHG